MPIKKILENFRNAKCSLLLPACTCKLAIKSVYGDHPARRNVLVGESESSPAHIESEVARPLSVVGTEY
jgi:hypothetical protein